VDFVSVVLPGMITGGVEYRAGDHRVFIGGAKPSTFSVHVSEIPNGARLRMEFTSPLTFQTAARDGKWILFLGEKPIQPLEQKFQFEGPYVRGLDFDDQDGIPKLIVTPATPGLDLFPVLEEGGKVLRADVVKPSSPEQSAPSEAAQAPSPSPAPGSQPAAQEGLPSIPSQGSGRVVVLDAGHGGQDLGAEGQNGVVEKNLAAQIVMRVRATLLASHNYRVILTRVGDTDPDFNQRGLIANTAHAAFFISFHAGNLNFGTPRVAVYSYQPPDPSMFSAAAPRPLFVPWSAVQAYHLEQSARLAQAIRDQFAGAPGVLSSSPGAAPVRVLRNVDAPAVAVEVGSLAPNVDSSGLLAADFQQKVSTAVLEGLETFVKKAN
jgi:N-acetylmuramoyl-L-alanine amidase